jgi:hypothetical protein
VDLGLTREQEAWEHRAANLGQRLGAQPADPGGANPADVVRELGGLGLLGIGIPETLGGTGGDSVDLVLAVAALARHDASAALRLVAQRALCAEHLLVAGTDQQQRLWIPLLAAGSAAGSWAPASSAPWTALDPPRVLAHGGEAGWTLEGRSAPVPNAAAASVCLLLAGTGAGNEPAGLSAFLLERGDPGFHAQPCCTSGLQGAGYAELIVEDCAVPGGRLVGSVGQALDAAESVLDLALIAMAALAVGLGRALLAELLERLDPRGSEARWVAERQSVQFRLADIATDLDSAELLTLRAAALRTAPGSTRLAAATAKLHACRAAGQAAASAAQILGTEALIAGTRLDRLLRDSIQCEAEAGSSDQQRLRIARELLHA